MIVPGVDTHKRTHALAAVDAGGGVVRGQRSITADEPGHLAALRWARELDAERVWAIEDCRHVSRRLELWNVLADRGVRVARETGALNLLPVTANFLAALSVHSGDFITAEALIDEVDAITQATGIPALRYARAMLAASRGDQAQMQAITDYALPKAMARGEGSAIGLTCWLTALLHNGHRESHEAVAAARRACEYEDAIFYGWALVELIVAGVRSGSPDEAAAALAPLSERTRASGT
jgi:hypothetical protein